MHLERGRYADQAKITTPALVIKSDGEAEEAELNLGDRLLLSRNMEGALRLSNLGLEHWPWRLYEGANLITGDGAVLLWRDTNGSDPSMVTFPLSPTLMLVIGSEIGLEFPVNNLVAGNSRRWLVGSVGTLTNEPARVASERKPAGPRR
jgi:hypothetical protein